MDADLLFDRDAGQVVAFAEGAIIVHQELGDDEARDSLGSRRGIRGSGEDDVDRVLREIVLTPGDEDLGTGDPVTAVISGNRLGAECTDVGSCVGLGQHHRAAPLAQDEFLEKGRLLFLGRVLGQHVHGPVGQHGAQRETEVGGLDHLLDGHGDAPGEATSTDLLGEACCRPSGLDELLVRLLVTGRRGDAAIGVPDASDGVADRGQRGDHLAGEPAGFVENPAQQVALDVCESIQSYEVVESDDVLHRELHVSGGRAVVSHTPEGRTRCEVEYLPMVPLIRPIRGW